MRSIRYRFPIAVKMALWLLLNLGLLALGGWLVFRSQFRAGFGSYLTNAASPRVEALAAAVTRKLRSTNPAEWSGALSSLKEAQGVSLAIFENNGSFVAGEPFELPEAVRKELAGHGGDFNRPGAGAPRPRPGRPDGPPERRFGPERGRPDERRPPPPPPPPRLASQLDLGEAGLEPKEEKIWPKFLVSTSRPTAYWIGVRTPLHEQGFAPVTLLVRCDSLAAGGLLLETKPLLFAAAGATVISVLFWLPFAFALTRQLRRVTDATSRVASGDFDVRLPVEGHDELGELSDSVNLMANQLDSLVRGQKRFLGDIAHELCSPVARMQAALAILEDREGDEKQNQYLSDLREELDDMGRLVDELLQLSKAGLQRDIRLQPVALAPLVAGVVAREAEGVDVRCDVPEGLTVQAEPRLLSRALGNVLRNAIRYAGGAGPIVVSAAPQQGSVALVVADSGSGVPLECLPRLFDAFYRPDSARTREAGGSGLGLAIVKTCIESCGGRVAARNGTTVGLEVVFALPSVLA